MAKWSNKIGFTESIESKPGVWIDSIIEHGPYYGDVYKNTRRLEDRSEILDGVNVTMNISFVADPYAFQNFHAIRYAWYMGTKWIVRDIDVQYPRLVITLGGVWNGQ